MALAIPRSLTPSKISAFTDCALAFRFAVIDKVPEPPSVPASRGTLVHAALERLFCLPESERTPGAALECLDGAWEALRTTTDITELGLDSVDEDTLRADAARLVGNYFELEDPRTVRPIGIELQLEVPLDHAAPGVVLRGIIDRLDLDGDDLVVTDYKTGKAPSERHERARLSGVHFYSFLCERLFGKRPARVQLLHLADPVALVAVPTARTTDAVEAKVGAIWRAVERACANDDFRPRPGRLCDWCSFRAMCPAHGGDPTSASLVAREARTGEMALPLPMR